MTVSLVSTVSSIVSVSYRSCEFGKKKNDSKSRLVSTCVDL